MRFPSLAWLLVALLWLTGCASNTRLVLLPDADGKVGAVTVSHQHAVTTVDRAYGSVGTRALLPGLSATESADPATVARDYEELLAAEPLPPVSFYLYFDMGSAELSEKFVAMLPQITEQIKAHLPTELRIIGYTDTTGSDRINDLLGTRRAKQVEKMLLDRLPALRAMPIQSYGSRDLLIPTPPNVDEPLNRCVEILIL